VSEGGYHGLELAFVDNPDFRDGSLVSLHVQHAVTRSGGEILLMDGDVLYDRRMIARLLSADGEGVLMLDREIEPGDEPVKICFNDAGRIVDFRKIPANPYVRFGESVGFFRFSGAIAAALADRCADYVNRGLVKTEYEEAIRDLILSEPQRFAAEDVSDLPWTEIDFQDDVIRARDVILPQLEA
jgi:choline kinase